MRLTDDMIVRIGGILAENLGTPYQFVGERCWNRRGVCHRVG
jgi:hypothetical protein